jgi:hypothetical protein
MTETISRVLMLACLVLLSATASEEAFAQQATPTPPPAAANPAETPRPAQVPQPPTETPAVVAEGSSAETLLGKPVKSAKDEDLGRVVNVIVDRSGMVRAAIIDFGGFLGVGTRKIAVDWQVLHFPDGGSLDRLIADLPRDQLRKAPAYKEGEPIVIMGRTTAGPAPQPDPAAKPAETVSPVLKP